MKKERLKLMMVFSLALSLISADITPGLTVLAGQSEDRYEDEYEEMILQEESESLLAEMDSVVTDVGDIGSDTFSSQEEVQDTNYQTNDPRDTNDMVDQELTDKQEKVSDEQAVDAQESITGWADESSDYDLESPGYNFEDQDYDKGEMADPEDLSVGSDIYAEDEPELNKKKKDSGKTVSGNDSPEKGSDKNSASENKTKKQVVKYTVLKGGTVKCDLGSPDAKSTYLVPAKYADKVSVDESGVITGLSKGKAVILATVNGTEYKIKVRVRDPYLSVTDGCVAKGGKLKIKLKDSDKSAVWKSSDEEVATVVKGKVRGINKGRCIITCTYMDKDYNCSLCVDEATLTTGELVLKCGETKRVGIYGIADPGYEEHWFTKGKGTVFTLTDNGAVTGVKKGKGKICITRGKKKYKIKVKVTDEVATDNSSDENYELLKVIADEKTKCHDIVEKIYANAANSMYVKREELGHDYEESSFTGSTCVEHAFCMLKCKRCGELFKEDKSLTEYPLKPHNLTNISNRDGNGTGSIWHCSVCGGDFVLTSGGEYVRLEDNGKDGSSSSGKDGGPSTGKDDGSSSGKDGGSSTGKDDGSSSGKDGGSSTGKDDGSSSGKDGGSSTGKDDGSSSGKDGGSSSGKDDGSSSGKDGGSSSGKDDGSSSGKDSGSSSGKDDGSSSVKTYKYTITYENTLSANNVNPPGYDDGDDIIELLPLNKRGYEFIGWFDEKGNQVDCIDPSLRRNRILRAEWEVIEYRIKYISTVSSCLIPEENPLSYTVEDEIVLKNPVEAVGYEFTGWTGTGVPDERMKVVISKGSVGSRTFTAHFKPVEYKIEYVMNGGDNHPDNPTHYTIEDEVVFGEPFRLYYSFDGFHTSGVLSPESRLDAIPVGSHGDLRLYAKWNKNIFDYEVKEVSTVYDGECHGVDMVCNTPGTKITYRDSKDEGFTDVKPVYTDAGIYTTYYKLEKDNYETVTGFETVYIDKAPGSVTDAKAVNSVYNGSAQKLMETALSDTGRVVYSLGSTSMGEYYDYIPTAIDAGSYYVWYYSIGDTNHYDSDKKCVQAKIDKAAGRVKSAPVAKSLTYNGTSQTLVKAGVAEGGTIYYRIGNTAAFDSYLPTATDAGVYTVYYYCAGDKNHYDSSVSSVNVTIAKKNMEVYVTDGTFAYTGNPDTGGAKVVVEDPVSGYSLTYGTTQGVYDKTAMPAFTTVGTHTAYYRVEAPNYNVATGSFNIIVEKGVGSYRGVMAKTLTYTGTLQELVTAGSTDTGTMYYSLNRDSGFTKTIPTALNAGNYFVYYYSRGNDNYNDSQKGAVKVTIKKAPLYMSFSPSYFYKTGYAEYPDIKVTSSAQLAGDEKVCVYFKGKDGSTWKSFPENASSYPGYSSSLPFNFTIKKSPLAFITDYPNINEGTYSLNYMAKVMNGGYGGSKSDNFETVTATCTYSIRIWN